ncbi:interferon regulatory factor 3 isoform 1-T6 [Discoglossus pictus]
MGSQKPRIVPWLIEQINSQTYPGLEWINNERTHFRIPWKHGLRQDRCEGDVKIFEAWAVASGAYDPIKDKPNPAVWKRNFRSALNRKVDIKVILDKSSESSNPHKIYEISRGNSMESEAGSEDANFSDGVSPCSDQLYLNNSQTNMNFTMDGNLSENMMHLQLSQNSEDLYLAPEDTQDPMGVMGPYNTHLTPQEVWLPTTTTPQAMLPEEAPVYHELSPYTATNEQLGADFQAPTAQEAVLNVLPRLFPNNVFETEFEVKVFYRGTLVKSCQVTNLQGFYITSRQQPSPEDYLENVVLPKPSMVLDQAVAGEINTLLQNLEHGTVVEVKDGKILAKRVGKCRSYWSMTDSPETSQPNQIDKNDYSVLCTLQQFIIELIEFIEGKRKESPLYSIWMCLGELWPDERSWKKKFIMVQITPIVMQILHQLSYAGGATSLRSSEVNLQISDSLSYSSATELLPFLRSIQEMMDF